MPSLAVSPPAPTDTVTVRAEVFVTLAVAVTVTVVALAFSPTEDGEVDRVMASESESFTVSVAPRTVAPDESVLPMEIVSSPSTALSGVGVRSTVADAVRCRAGKTIERSATVA